jgi:hypothetical protein
MGPACNAARFRGVVGTTAFFFTGLPPSPSTHPVDFGVLCRRIFRSVNFHYNENEFLDGAGSGPAPAPPGRRKPTMMMWSGRRKMAAFCYAVNDAFPRRLAPWVFGLPARLLGVSEMIVIKSAMTTPIISFGRVCK